MHPGLRLYALCKATKWAHLPVAGGWFDQSPGFVDHVFTIMGIDAAAEKKRSDKQMKKNGKNPKARGM